MKTVNSQKIEVREKPAESPVNKIEFKEKPTVTSAGKSSSMNDGSRRPVLSKVKEKVKVIFEAAEQESKYLYADKYKEIKEERRAKLKQDEYK